MNVLFISPGFPFEMPFFVEGLASIGASVIGLGDQPAEALPARARHALAHHHRATSLWDEQRTVDEIRQLSNRVRIDRVECLWEPGMILAARIREALGLPGLTVDQTLPFRDKEIMKQRLDAAGVRTPRHGRAMTTSAVREHAERIGYPLCIKPIAGAGSADTHRVDSPEDLERILPLIRHVPEVSVEEFIEGEEFTYDTICAGGKAVYENICWYRPRPLIARTLEWVSPQTVALRDPFVDYVAPGRALGLQVQEALGYEAGFTHMEWFRKPDGEAVFGEIGARPPGARTVEIMNYASDTDVFVAWAQAVTTNRLEMRIDRKYHCAHIFKRAEGQGRIHHIEGLDSLLGRYGRWMPVVDLLPIGAPRRDWKATLVSDGMVIARHPEMDRILEIVDAIGTDLRMYARPD